MTLLRGAEWPDPDADRGTHEFTYSLLPHSGDRVIGDTVRRAWELNSPMSCVPGGGGDGASTARRSFFSVSGPAVLEALKPAENGDGWIVRLYEPHGGRWRVSVRTPLSSLRVSASNHVVEGDIAMISDGGEFNFDIKPFEVRTFRLRSV